MTIEYSERYTYLYKNWNLIKDTQINSDLNEEESNELDTLKNYQPKMSHYVQKINSLSDLSDIENKKYEQKYDTNLAIKTWQDIEEERKLAKNENFYKINDSFGQFGTDFGNEKKKIEHVGKSFEEIWAEDKKRKSSF